MKKLILLLIALVFISSFAQAEWQFHTRKLAQMKVFTQEDIRWLNMNDYITSKVDFPEVYLYLNAEELSLLKSRGYDVDYIPDISKIYADGLEERTMNTDDPLDDYHTHEELTAELQLIAENNPDICHLVSAGMSVQGRELWVMEISDNVMTEEDEPEFMYISSMHGDEVVGMEMCMYLINYLTDNYPEDLRVRFLVDETHIYILPDMNPDGTAAHSRFNANGFDLNRQFPDRIDDPFNSTVGRPMEVGLLMEFGQMHSPVLSANYHGGTLVMNYPYDSNPNFQNVNTPTPDDDWFIDLALTYSSLNLPMYNGPFPQGITNGADWYAIYGGMQDFVYTWEGRADITIEVSEQGWPPENQLPGFWEDNRESMLAYMMKVHHGVRGIVTDETTGLPIPSIITVAGNYHEVYPDPDVGDYYRLLLPGSYNMEYYCYGYVPVSVQDVVVLEGQLTRVDVQMTPAEPGYVFDDLEGTTADYTHSAITTGFTDQWHLSEQRSSTPTHSFKCGAVGTGNYANLLDAGLVTPVLNVQLNSKLSFWHYIDSEISGSHYPYAYDGGLVEIKIVGDSVWTQIIPEGGYPKRIRNTGGSGPFPPETPVFAGNIEGREVVFNLAGYEGEVQFRFRFGADGSVAREGWYIDDIELTSDGGAVLAVTLTPENPPIVIPAGGGTFGYTLDIENISGGTFTFDGWIEAVLPDGSVYGPILLRPDLTLNPSASIIRTMTQNVPANAPAGTYTYRLNTGNHPDNVIAFDEFDFDKSGVDANGYVGDWRLDGWNESGLAADLYAPSEYYLAQNYPNPFNPVTVISFQLLAVSYVNLTIYDITGREVSTLVDGMKPAGRHQIVFDGSNLASGVYFCRLTAGDFKAMKKMLLVK